MTDDCQADRKGVGVGGCDCPACCFDRRGGLVFPSVSEEDYDEFIPDAFG